MKEGLSKLLLKKKILSLIMVVSIIFGMLPTTASAVKAGLQIADYENSVNPAPKPLEKGEIWVDKEVVYDTVTNDGTFNVTLKAAGRDYKIKTGEENKNNKVDVVLVLDISGSMDSNKMTSMKAAAKSTVNTLLATGLENRVALVTYSGMADLKVNFTNSPGVEGTGNGGEGLLREIRRLSANGGTNIQNAFFVAQNTILERTDKTRSPIIILMSDGEPTYYHENLNAQNTGNRQGSGNSSGSEYVWYTIQQAMEAKRVIKEDLKDNEGPKELKIYTIGFGVGNDELAKATLMPTDSNKPYTFNGESKTDMIKKSYFMGFVTDTEENPGNWKPDSVISFGTPQNIIESLVSDNTILGTGTRTFKSVYYRNMTPEHYDHEYYESLSTTTSTDPLAILQAFMTIVEELTTISKPVSWLDDSSAYSDLVITDVIGGQFEAVGALPSGVELDTANNTVKWTLNGDDFNTIPHNDSNNGALTPDSEYINKVTFKVKIKDTAGVGTHYTNELAKAEFTVPSNNPFYNNVEDEENYDEDGEIKVDLGNKGSLTLEQIGPTIVTITVTKNVSGPVPDDQENTFTFDVYADEEGGEKLNKTTLSITVKGAGSESDEISLELPYDAFKNGQEKLYVQENEEAPDYWTYDNESREQVTLTKTNASGTVTFDNVYTPPGTITVTKQWSIGNNPDAEWPDDVDAVMVQLWEEPIEQKLDNPQMFRMFMDEGEDLGDEDKDLGDEDKDLGDEDKDLGDEDKDLGDEDKDLGDEDKNLSDEDKDLGDEDKDLGDEDKDLGDEDKDLGDEDKDLGDEDKDPGDEDKDLGDEDKDLGDEGDDGETFEHNAQLLFAGSEASTDRALIETLVLTKENPSNFFKPFVRKDGYRYFINEVEVEGYNTLLDGSVDGEDIIFDDENRAEITILNIGNDPDISITKEVLNTPLTLSGGKATFNYKLVVTNTGNTTLMSVTVDDVMSGPTGATLEYSDNTRTFDIEIMEPGESKTITYSVIVDKAGEYTNEATATCWYNGNPVTDTSDEVTATVNPEYVPPVTPPVTPPSGGGGGYTPSQGTVKVNYVDVNGNALADGDELTGMVGTDYSTSAKTIDGYTLTAVPENSEGTFVNGVIMVTYKYNAENTEIEIEEEETPEGTPEEQIIDEELPEALPQTGLPIATVPELFGGALIALGLYFGIKSKKDEE